ncbi:MAG: NUDIX hydrolase, partial [Myxococcota bacterium]
ADGCRGQASETDEAVPLWTAMDDIPYGEMWPDDRYWLPLVLTGSSVFGRFIYDGDTLIDHMVTVTAPAP